MNKTQERFVAFIDIMGFQDLVAKNNHETVLEKLETISRCISEIKEVNKGEIVKNLYDGEELKPFIFSDSIVIFTKGSSPKAIRLLLHACGYLFLTCMKKHIPIKGAISFGKVTLNEEQSIFFGQPLIDSFLLHNEVNYYGMVLHHAAESKIKSFEKGIQDFSDIVKSLKTPTSNGQINYYNLIYNLSSPDNKLAEDLIFLDTLYNSVSVSPRRYVDNTIEMYKTLRDG